MLPAGTDQRGKSALQTAGENETRLEVPEYIQAVMMDDDANISVDYLDIPDTVLYIAGNNDGLKVKKRLFGR